jgi:hypothetical protein
MTRLLLLLLASCGPVSSRAAHQRLAVRHLGHHCAQDNFEHERRVW